jgi:iron complex outermembrane receptor protein
MKAPLHFAMAATLGAALAAAGAVRAQTGTAPPPEPAPQRVEITGARAGDEQERRESTAAKIVVGRDEIERYGDATVGDLLKRLPGVTAGSGGSPRMRGLGSGYTQILLDGERLPRGFSLDALSPEQIERIEVYRAPTAETGARAIAGTVNIVTREGLRRRLNEVKLSVGTVGAGAQPELNFARNDSAGDLTYNVFGALFRSQGAGRSVTTTTVEALDDGELLRLDRETSTSHSERQGLRLGARAQWRLGDGTSLVLAPFLIRSASDGASRSTLVRDVGAEPAPYATSASDGEGTFALTRLNTQVRHLLGDGTRLEWNLNGWHTRSTSEGRRVEFDADGVPLRTRDDASDAMQRTLTASVKAQRLLDNGHQLVAGAEAEVQQRRESRTLRLDGVPLAADVSGGLDARLSRSAVYVQDEWQATPQWAFNAGLRWEAITVRGAAGDEPAPRHRSVVLTPLLHAVWKPDPKARNQVRVSVTRSYRTPSLAQLVALPAIDTTFPPPGTNDPTRPDRVGNPALRPELATGVDVAFERYPEGGGVLSAGVFHRRIADLIRTRTTLETVPWADAPRWVSRPANVGDATTQGLELEAKGRWRDLVAAWGGDADAAPRVDLRFNASVYRSRVDGVPGPDNRLDEQPGVTANVGADWRVAGWPLTLGGNLNWTPGYRTRLSATEWVEVDTRRVFDAYALWTVSPALAWRLSVGNAWPRDTESLRTVAYDDVRQTATTVTRGVVSWLLRLEMKL